MKNGKDRNVYDVMNDVNVDIETMDMSDEEKDACVKRLRHKVKARETGRNHGWKTAAAAVAAVPTVYVGTHKKFNSFKKSPNSAVDKSADL